jgi:hypothetical protein
MCNLMSVESISALSSGSLSSAMSWETKSGMFSLKCQDFDLNQDPYSLTSLPTGALQIETFVCAPLSAMYMATYNSARFSAAQGVLHRQFGSFTLQASSQSLKNFSLHKSFEEWFDTTRMVVSINLINGTTGPIMLTYTGLEMGSLNVKDWLVDWVEMVSTIVNFTNARPDLDSLALSSSSLSSPLSGMSKSRMFHQRYKDPYSLASLTKEDLQLLTHACTLLFSKNMARVVVNTNEFNTIMITYTVLGEDLERLTHDCTPLCTVNVAIHNFDRFSTVRSSPLPGWEVPIFRRVTAIWKKLISLHNTFEDGLDIAMLVDNINVMNRPTVPTVFTVTSLVMGYVIMESDEFFCRRAVLPPDSFVDVI